MQQPEIKVYVVDYGRTNLMLRYVDPVTGKHVSKSAGTADEKDAEREAGKWEAEVLEGRYKSRLKITWAEFRERYEDEVLTSLAENTVRKVSSVFNAIEELIAPARLESLDSTQISKFQSKLRSRKVRAGAFDKKTQKAVKAAKTPAERRAIIREFHAVQKGGRTLAESTIKSHLVHLQSALMWAHSMKMLREVPDFKMPKRAKSQKLMKGRPITTEEFERMLEKISDVVGTDPTVIESWRFYLRGMWTSGLRLEESLELYWDGDRHDKLQVDFSGKHPMLRIPADMEKGNTDRLLPIAPEFARFLWETPEDKRHGRVFAPLPKRPKAPPVLAHRVGELVTAIGTKAGVKVSTDPRTGKVKYASAHDLRRSFGERWARRVMPPKLMELMRHSSIETTMRFYIGRNAEDTADALWEADSAIQTAQSAEKQRQAQGTDAG